MENNLPMTENEISHTIIGAAIEVHRTLGPGLLERAYEACLIYELKQKGFLVNQQVSVPIEYKNVKLEQGYRLDLLVENKVIVELKSVAALHAIHTAQMITYLRLSQNKLGLIINFNEGKLIDGIKRIVNGF